MQAPNIKTAERVVPMIYAYTTPGVIYHDGYIKVGFTEQEVDKRIYDQTHTAGIMAKKEWQGTAIFDDGSGDTFTDKPLHAYMRKQGVKQPQDLGNEYFDPKDRNEWFYTTPAASRGMFFDFKANRGIMDTIDSVIPYTLRKEQAEAVEKTVAYYRSHPGGEFLWNCKPRFGKTLTVYDFCKQIDAKMVLIVTNRPAIANSWLSDYMQFIGQDSGYYFVSDTDALKGKPGVISRSAFSNLIGNKPDLDVKCIEFVSLQDMKGSKYFSTNNIDKLREVADLRWSLLVIDEAHEGVDTYKSDVAFDRVHRDFTLHLSGTPFKAIASSKFPSEAIYNWTYADEQQAKADWDSSEKQENPYEVLPKIILYTYQMSEIIRDQLVQGVEIRGETVEYAFDLNEFFRTENGRFVYNASVDRFLDALTTQKKFPFSTPELRKELKHTFWLLDRVESARALAKKLRGHPVFGDYEIVLAAGDGKLDDDDENAKSFDKVVKAIAENEKTITLSVGQLTLGVTIPEWTAVLMLSNIKSPALYMQAAFRAQNPCLFRKRTGFFRKENCYVFDFDPARTLNIYEEFANDLSIRTAGGRGDLETRKDNIRTLLNFFPVIGEDEEGELVELDPEKVLTIPRKIRSLEVVRRGFMSNFLFQNIAQVFGAPQELLDIINKLEPVPETRNKVSLPQEVRQELSLNEEGEVELTEDYVIGKSADIFGEKIAEVTTKIEESVAQVNTAPDQHAQAVEALKSVVHEITRSSIISEAKDKYGEEMRPSDARRLESQINSQADRVVEKELTNHVIEKNTIEQQRNDELKKRFETGRSTEEIDREFDQKQKDAEDLFQARLKDAITDVVKAGRENTVKTVETAIKERKKATIEDGIRDHLRGFSRTIPSFLMAYGDDTVTLATFDAKVPGKVFKEVTSISIEEFRQLRDGGTWRDPETGEEKEFKSSFFDPVVFDDSVKEFLNLKRKLADYFDEKSVEDIFDYIPPQKTFQIFTPKLMVQRMVDQLEKENPGCFDDPDHTFIDLYMKSGMYPAEIVKRLYRSAKMRELFPDGKDRLKHIFEKQVFGLAPTEIIYNIALSYILGFDEDVEITKHNFRLADALPYAKAGKLQELLDRLYDND